MPDFEDEFELGSTEGMKYCRKCDRILPIEQFYKKSIHCRECTNIRANAWMKENKSKRRQHAKKAARKVALKNLNMTLEDYDKIVKEQNNKCKICNKEDNRALSIDHCHKTNKFRGLLCGNCNILIGHYEKILNNKKLKQIIDKYLNVKA